MAFVKPVRRQVYVVPVKGGRVSTLTHGRTFKLNAVWSPDGSQVAPDGTAIAFGHVGVKVLDLESGEIEVVAGRGGRGQAAPPAWQSKP